MKEIQDIYDANRHPTGKKYERWSNLLKTNEYVIVVEIIIFNKQNEILLSRRSANKKRNPLKWETTQGSVKSKEKSQEAAIRELKEELGISVTEDDLRIYKTIKDDSEHIFKDLSVDSSLSNIISIFLYVEFNILSRHLFRYFSAL